MIISDRGFGLSWQASKMFEMFFVMFETFFVVSRSQDPFF
jgi:hypothetical protein